MPFTYQAVLNVDYDKGDSNEQARLRNALVQAGWRWVETSAFVIATDDLGLVWRGVDLVARQTASVGDISALTFHIQGSPDFNRPAPTERYANALENILERQFPQPKGIKV